MRCVAVSGTRSSALVASRDLGAEPGLRAESTFAERTGAPSPGHATPGGGAGRAPAPSSPRELLTISFTVVRLAGWAVAPERGAGRAKAPARSK
jgi:hypothetical protein